jgi:hypothetical protein
MAGPTAARRRGPTTLGHLIGGEDLVGDFAAARVVGPVIEKVQRGDDRPCAAHIGRERPRASDDADDHVRVIDLVEWLVGRPEAVQLPAGDVHVERATVGCEVGRGAGTADDDGIVVGEAVDERRVHVPAMDLGPVPEAGSKPTQVADGEKPSKPVDFAVGKPVGPLAGSDGE